MTQKIVVTGIGATTPLGGDAPSTWRALLAGESGISTLEQEWVARYEIPVTFAGQAKVKVTEVLTPQEAKRLHARLGQTLVHQTSRPSVSLLNTPPESVEYGHC
ncbi:MAG: hypothetical protein RLZZ90_1150 [Actinomycetota bacterium]